MITFTVFSIFTSARMLLTLRFMMETGGLIRSMVPFTGLPQMVPAVCWVLPYHFAETFAIICELIPMRTISLCRMQSGSLVLKPAVLSMFLTELQELPTIKSCKKQPVSKWIPADDFRLVHTACAVIMIRPVSAGQIRVRNHTTGIGGVDKLAVADVDTHVRNAGGGSALEKDQVAGL